MKKSIIILITSTIIFGCSNSHIATPKNLTNESLVQNSNTPQLTKKEKSFLATVEPEVLTLQHALALTLEKNPTLKSYSYGSRIDEARIIQANLIPNPEFSLEVEDVLGSGKYSGSSNSQSTLQLSQLIELGSKRSARVRVATAMQAISKDEYEIKRVEVLSNLTEKFIRTVADQHLLLLANKAQEIAKHALKNISKRSSAGGASELEEAKARVIFAKSTIDAEHAQHQLATSKYELSAFWGADQPIFSKLSADLFKDVSFPSFEQIYTQIDSSLEIKKWANEKRLREAQYELEKAKSIPNLLLGAGIRRIETSADQSFVFQLSLPLNIFDRNQGSRREASILKDKVIVDKDISELHLKTTLFALYQELSHFKTASTLIKKEILPQAERSLKIAQNGYDQGRFSYLDLVDAQRTLIEVSRDNIEAAYLLNSYINTIEKLLGAPLNISELKTN